MKKVVLIALGVMVAGIVGVSLPAGQAVAETTTRDTEFAKGVCNDPNIADDLKSQAGCDVSERALSNTAVNLINIAIAIIGLVAVVVIVIGGIMYATSLGEPGKMTQAKNMIIYAVIALIVAVSAWAIVQTVIASVPKTESSEPAKTTEEE